MSRNILTPLLFASILLGGNGCLGSPRTKIVLVRERAAFQDPKADVDAMERRLGCAGARGVQVRRSGDTAEFSFSPPKNSTSNWAGILARPGIFATSSLVEPGRFPLFLPTLRLRFGREVDLLPDVPGREGAFAAAALIVPERKSAVDAALETIEFISILGQNAFPAWGAMPGYYNKGGVKRAGAELFLLPPPRLRGGPISNEVIDSAVFVSGSDSTLNGVELHLKPQGRAAYMELTQEMMGTFVAILVDDQVLGAEKVVQPVSSDRFWIPGCGLDCRDLAVVLGGGPVRGVWKIVAR